MEGFGGGGGGGCGNCGRGLQPNVSPAHAKGVACAATDIVGRMANTNTGK